MPKKTKKPAKLKNIGPVTTGWLHEIDIDTLEQIRELGVVEVYRRLKERFPDRVTLNALYGLEAALTGVRWDQLPDELKAELRAQVEA